MHSFGYVLFYKFGFVGSSNKDSTSCLTGCCSEDSGFAGAELAQPSEAFDTYSFAKTYAL